VKEFPLPAAVDKPDQNVRLALASGDCEIDLSRRELRVLGSLVPVGGRAFEIVEILARSVGELVTKNELMDRIWPGAIVTENTLQVHAMAIRKALGPYRTLLKTESGRGYRLLGDWTARRHDATYPPVGLQRMRADGKSPVTNIPATVTHLIGRTAAVAKLRDLISAYRLVTLTGPGGIGKTSLALKAARGIVGEFADGGWLVELAPLSDLSLVPSAVAGILSLKLESGDISAEVVARAIGDRELLLILDNCEHVIEAAADLAETLVRLCSGVTILATSREVLRMDSELVYRVPPLEIPAPGQDDANHILNHGAVELFIARSKEFNSGFALRTAELPAVAAICRRLDGIPLAIEFAAARSASLGIQVVANTLGDRLASLTGGRRTAPPRHRTLRGVLDWSYDLLPEPEQRLLRHLAIFPAGFTIGGAVAVMLGTGADPSATMHGIGELVSKSLVVLDKSGDRWSMLETIEAYALEKLVEHGERDSASRRHATYFRDLFSPAASGSQYPSVPDKMARLGREIDNVRAALDWSFSASGDLEIGRDLSAAYGPVWLHLSLMAECRDRCERALLDLQPHDRPSMGRQMRLHAALGSALLTTMGPAEQTKAILAKTLETAERLGDFNVQARVLLSISGVMVYRGEYGEARIAVERLTQIAQQIDDPEFIVVAEHRMGTTLLTTGRLAEARVCLERAVQRPAARAATILYQSDVRAASRAMLARALCLLGFMEKAQREAQASLDELRGTAHKISFCRVLYYGMCRIALMMRDIAAAESAIAHLVEAATSLNAPFWRLVGRLLEGKLMIERGAFGEGVEVLRTALETCRRTGWRPSYPEFMGALAEGLAGLERPGEALGAVNDAIGSAGQGTEGQVWYVPELLRIKSGILLWLDDMPAAEETFSDALNVAREQEALFWELRATHDLARVRVKQGRGGEARQLLAHVYDRFTEGFETPDLRAAKAFLDELPR
jgi:predicted ATPase/DNA-binding winged helix-turn-helix (wHTH) protein